MIDFKKAYNEMDSKKKWIVITLIVALVFSFYYNNVYKTHLKNLRNLKSQVLVLKNRYNKLNSQMPDVKKEQLAISELENKHKDLQSEIYLLEAELPSLSNISSFLSQLISLSADLGMDFIHIKQGSTEKKQDYARLNFEIKFSSDYAGFVNYLYRLGKTSNFTEIKKIEIEQSKELADGFFTATLAMTTLLGGNKNAQVSNPKEKDSGPFENIVVAKNPFMSGYGTGAKGDKKEEYILTGITFLGANSTAIINTEVYRVGDFIGANQVKAIFQDKVILQNGSREICLSLERD